MSDFSGKMWIRMAPRSGWVVAGLLLVAILLTWVTSKLDGPDLSDQDTSQLLVWQEQSFDQIQKALTVAYAELHSTATEVATSRELIEGFRNRTSIYGGDAPVTGSLGTSEQIVRILTEYNLAERGFIEIYDQSPSLIAWNGPVFPMDAGISNPDFLVRPVEDLARDGAKRTALTVWQPVLDGSRVLGAVRMGKVVESFMPIRNDYLRDFSWSEEWSNRLRSLVYIEFGELHILDQGTERALKSSAGKVIGKVRIELPDSDSLAKEKAQKYNDILVFWVVLILFWLLMLFTRSIWLYYKSEEDADNEVPSKIHMSALGAYVAYVFLMRWVFLVFEVPARWQPGKTPLSPLFDPQHLASVFGFGALRTIGDLLISASLLTLVCIVALRATAWIRSRTAPLLHFDANSKMRFTTIAVVVVHTLLAALIAAFLYQVSSHTILDSTLDFFARSGLLPERLILVVFSALLLIVFSAILIGGRLVWVCLLYTSPSPRD